MLRKAYAHLGAAGDTLVTRYMHEVLFDHEFAYDVEEDFKAELRATRGGLGDAAVAAAMREMAPALAEAISQAALGSDLARGEGGDTVASGDDADRPGGRRR